MPTILFSWFFGDSSPFWRRYLLGCLLALASLAPSYLNYASLIFGSPLQEFQVQGSVLEGKPLETLDGRFLPIFDPDGAKWSLLVEESLKKGTWRMGVSPVDSVGESGPDTVYWASGYFVYLRILSLVFLLFGFSTAAAVGWGACLAGPLLVLVALFPMVWLALRVLPSFWGLFLFPLIFFEPKVGMIFAPFLPDHHGMIFLAICFWVMTFFLSSPRAWIYSGVALGVSLWLSLLTTIPVFAVFGIGAMVSAFSGTPVIEPGVFRKWGILGAGVALVLWFVDYFPARMGMRLEIVNPVWLLAVIGAVELFFRFSLLFSGKRQPGFFSLSSPWLGWVIPALLVVLPGFCIIYSAGGWFWPSFPWVESLMGIISELQPVPYASILISGGFTVIFLALLFCFLVGKTRVAGFLISALLCSVFYAFQARWMPFLALLTFFFLLFGLGELVRVYSEKGFSSELLNRVALGCLCIVGMCLFVPALVYYRGEAKGHALLLEGKGNPFARVVSDAQVSRLMRQVKGGDFVVLGPPDLGTRAAYYGNGRSVGSMYWEAWRGLRSATDFWAADMDVLAFMVLVEHNVDFVIFRGDMPTKFSKEGRDLLGEPVFDRIKSGKIPEWLTPVEWVPTDESGYKLFRVVREKVPGMKP